jgi:transglutaminase-like putative cysteine protease
VTQNSRMTVTTAVACVLTSTVLLPLYLSTGWFFIAIGAVIAVAATGALTRLRTLPVPVCLAVSVAGLVLYLNLVFEARHSLLYLIPTPNSLARLWDLAGSGMHEANRYAPPAPSLPGLLLLAAGGVGITAVLADLMAVRLQSTALAGLPLLVLFAVPVMMNAQHSQYEAALVFCVGGAGYLAMLSADGRERIRVWGRLVSLWRAGPRFTGPFDTDPHSGAPIRVRGRGHGPDTRALAAAGRRIGLASIVLALCAPLLVPGLHPSKLLSSGPGIGGNGGGGGISLTLSTALAQTVQQLHQSRPVTMFTYTTDATPVQQQNDAEYFRQYVFDTLGDTGWQVRDYASNSRPVKDIGDPEGLIDTTSTQTVTSTVSVSKDFPIPNGQPTFLPLPYPAIHIVAPGKWLADQDRMVYSTTDTIAGQSYSVASVLVDPSQQQLKAVPALVVTPALQPDLLLPQSYQTAALKKLAEFNTAGRSTEFAKVDALATWLSSAPFSYSLAVTPFTSPAGLLKFLTRTNSGFCVQYAFAMTVLTRLLGIPARFVVGYTAGTRLKTGSYVVKTVDAHAWTEVYFPTFGWVRFEPTPPGQGTAAPPNYMTNGAGRGPGSVAPPIVKNSLQPGQAGSSAGPSKGPHIPGASLGPGEGSAGGRTGTPWTAVALAVIAAIVLAFGLIAVVAPPARRAMSANPAQVTRRRMPLGTATAIFAAAAALAALALYRLLSRASGLNLTVGWATVGIAFGATAAAALVTPAAFRFIVRRWRWMRARDDASRAHAAWREFHDDLADFGIASRSSEPPRTLAARITSTLPEPAAAAVARLALAEERASYAARPAESQHLRRDGTTARRGLATTARWTTRCRATVFPASMMTTLAETAARIPEHATTRKPRQMS